jgi:hypothetical protein
LFTCEHNPFYPKPHTQNPQKNQKNVFHRKKQPFIENNVKIKEIYCNIVNNRITILTIPHLLTYFIAFMIKSITQKGAKNLVRNLKNYRLSCTKPIKHLTCLLILLFSSMGWGQVTVTNPSNTTPAMSATYTSLALAITDVNNRTAISGPVTITLDASSPQTAPAGGYSITNTAITGGSNTNRFIFDGGGNTITAPTPQTSGNLNDAIFKIIGADFITIQNFTMQENASNTATTAASNNMTEFGVSLFYASPTNGAQNNIIQNNIISLNRTYQNSFGIYSNVRHTALVISTTADITNVTGSNAGNKVYGNTISNVNYGIVFIGCGSTTSGLQDNGNDIGGSSSATGNTISNSGGIGVATSGYISLTSNNYLIFTLNQYNDNISYNNITSATGTTTGTIVLGGILKNYSTTQPTGTITTTINNNTITITNAPAVSATGSVIGINNQGLTPLLSTATISINNNIVQNCVNGGSNITSGGFTGITNLSLPGTMNMNGNSVINNAITGATATSGSLTAISNTGAAGTLNINNNIVRSLASSTASGQIAGIVNSGAVVTALNINNNALGNSTSGFFTTSTATSGSLFGISTSAGASTCLTTIQSNDIRGITYNLTASAANAYITSTGAVLNNTISNNTFTNLSVNTTGSVTFVNHNYTMPASATQTISGNSIVTAFSKTGAGGTVTIATSLTSSPNGTFHTFTNNNFSNITVTGATAITGVSNLDGSLSSATRTVTGNTFNNWTGGTSAITGFSYGYIGGTTSSFSTNTFTNITGQGAITGINLGSSANLATTVNVASNTINNLSSTGTGGQVLAISCSNTSATININSNAINTLSSTGASSAVGAITVFGATTTKVFQNVIYDLSTSGTIAPIALGIQVAGGTLVNVYRNKVYNLSASGGALTSLASAVSGIYLSGGTTVNTFNNLIGNLTTPNINLADAIRGINIVSTSSSTSYNVYNNTVYLTGGSVGTNFGTSGIYHTASATATTAALDLQNNMIFNMCTPSGSGIVSAFRRSAAATLGNYKSTSNKNLFYAGTQSATTTIMSDGTNNYQTLATFQTAVSTRDANSFTETSFDPATYFVSTTGSNANYLQPASGLSTQAEGGGNTITMCSPDYNGVTRPGFSGAAYDVGAWEFAGVSPAPVLTNMTPSTALTAQCTKVARTISIDITTASGTITGATLNYNHNGTAQTAVTMTNSSGNIWTGTMLAPSTGNATVTWSITATNSLGLNTLYSGTSYADEPTTGITATATATPSTICSGNTTSLNFSAISSQTVSGARNAPASTSNATAFSYGLVFDVTTAFTLNSVQVYNGSSAGTMTIVLQNNSGTQLQTLTTPTIPSGTGSTPTTVSIGWNIPVGSGYRLLATTSPSLVRESSLGGFPYAVGSFGSITSGYISGTSTTYYYFYNWSVTPLVSTPSSYSWSDGSSVIGTSNPQTATPSGTPTYTCTATVNDCPMTASVTPTVNPAPVTPSATNSSQCGTATPTCSVTGTGNSGNTFKWYLAATGGTALVGQTANTLSSYPVSATTSFYVSEFNGTCESARVQVTVTVTAAPTITAAASVNPVCSGSATSLTATSANSDYTYTWSNSAGSGASVTVNPTSATTYTVTGTDASGGVNNGCSTTASISITTNAVPSAITLTPASASICFGSTQSIVASGGNGATTTPNNHLTQSFETASLGFTPSTNATATANTTYYSNGSNSLLFNTSTVSATQSLTQDASMDLTGYASATLSFSHIAAMESYLGASDWGAIQYSNDGGTNWSDFAISDYSGTSSTTVFAASQVRFSTTSYSDWSSVFTGTSALPNNSLWKNEQFTIPVSALTSQFKIRFRYKTDGSVFYYGWLIDNIVVTGYSNNISWSPTTALYTDAAATTAYTGNPTTVYAKPTATTTYTATATSAAGCTSSSSVAISIITDKTWLGTTNNSWNTPSNWSCGSVPSSSDVVVISSGNPVLDTNFTVGAGGSLTLSGTGTLTINPASTLTVAGTANFGGKAVTIKSNATGNGAIGQVTGTLTGATNVTVERYIPSGKRAFRLLSPAVTTTTFISGNWQGQTHITGGASGGFDVTETNLPSMFTYNNNAPSGTGWTAIANTDATNLTAGVGYRVLIRGDRTPTNITAASADAMNAAITLSATGTLRTGEVALSSSTTPAINNTSNTTTAGYSLVGNPYQSAVDWNAVTKSGIDVTYWAWDPNMGSTSQRGRYVSFNGTVNSVIDGTGSSNVTRYIQPGQAFFVKNTVSGTAGTLTFQESHKATTSANVFRTNNQTESTNFATLSTALYDPNELAIGGYPIDAMKAVFSSAYTNELGLGDATKLEAAGENIAWFRNNTKLAIDAAAPVTTSDELAMKTLRLGANKNYTFKIQTTNFDTALTPYLVDTFLNTQTEISTSQAYLATFATTSNVASYSENRFKIVFQNALLSTDTFATQVGLYPNPSKGNGFYLQLPSSAQATVKLYNTLGQEIAISHNEGHYQANQSLAAGVYHIMVTQGEKTSKLKWIVE